MRHCQLIIIDLLAISGNNFSMDSQVQDDQMLEVLLPVEQRNKQIIRNISPKNKIAAIILGIIIVGVFLGSIFYFTIHNHSKVITNIK